MPLKDRGLKCVPGLSMTHTDNQGINTVVPGSYTAVLGPHTTATSTIPDGAIIPDRHGSIRQFCKVPGAPRTLSDVPGPTRIDTELHGGYTFHIPDQLYETGALVIHLFFDIP
ncbi:hypothetical protein DPMN_005545 [Dreissena polymorpha]|uniref:Uncharacterized protein n=1 Tax=Dreissena polymorpha TaxID=45954 RepID=A0A9D4MTS3_DREPO|nr:hypothetical protein DPMN_005545 [Dreissena polymorpha]